MKKVICWLLCLCLCVGLTACKGNGPETQKFNSEEEMSAHLQGVWKTYDDKCLVFDGDRMALFEPSRVARSFYAIIKEDGFEAFENMSADELLAALREDWKEEYIAFTMEPQEGKLTLNIDSDDTDIIYVLNDECTLEGDSAQLSWGIYRRVLNDNSAETKTLMDIVKEEKESYVPPRELIVMSPKEYAEAIKALHPAINSYTLVYEKDDLFIYTDTGKTGEGNYTGSWNYADDSMMFEDKQYRADGSYKVVLQESVKELMSWLLLVSGHKDDLSRMVRDALTYFNGYSQALTQDELLSLFNEKAQDYYGGKTFVHEHEDITYQINITKEGRATVTIEY